MLSGPRFPNQGRAVDVRNALSKALDVWLASLLGAFRSMDATLAQARKIDDFVVEWSVGVTVSLSPSACSSCGHKCVIP